VIERLRRAARRSPVRGMHIARSVAQPPLRPSRPARGPEGQVIRRIARRPLFLARVFRLQMGRRSATRNARAATAAGRRAACNGGTS
jgi:hypothetical protein